VQAISLHERSETHISEKLSLHGTDSVPATAAVEANGDKKLGNIEKEDFDGKTEQSSQKEKDAGADTITPEPASTLAPSVKAEKVAEEQNGPDTEAEDESKYPGGFALGILTFGLCMATFVVALDNTIIGELSDSSFIGSQP